MRYGWPDIIITVSVIIGAVRGWKIGFISELGGIIAIIAALIAAIMYPGSWDGFIVYYVHLNPDSAHVFAECLYALTVYGVIALVALVLNRYVSSTFIGPIDAVGGSIVGALKALFLFWSLLYIALFLPLSHALRTDLRNSFLVPFITDQNSELDSKIRPAMPWFVRPFAAPFLRRHQL